MLDGVGDVVLVGLLEDDVCVGGALTRRHGEVGQGCEGCDQGCDYVEETLLLLERYVGDLMLG